MTAYHVWKVTTALVALGVVAAAMPANAQNLPGWGYAQQFMGSMTRQQQQEQQRQVQATQQQQLAQQQAEAREREPHAVSAQYSGELRSYGDARQLFSGKTVYFERPIVANHQLIRMFPITMYYAPSGEVFDLTGSTNRWTIIGDSVCFTIPQQSCSHVVQDSTNRLFFLNGNVLSNLVRTAQGDPENLAKRYATARRQQAAPTTSTPNGEYAASQALAGMLFNQIGKNPSYCYDFLGRYKGNRDGITDCDPRQRQQ